MFIVQESEFSNIVHCLAWELHTSEPVRVGEWQSQKVTHPNQDFLEIENVVFQIHVPSYLTLWQKAISPNLPWAEEHFQERVGGKPLNPPPSAAEWPFIQSGHGGHVDREKKFSHTYPERFWPKSANSDEIMQFPNGRKAEVNTGIRYAYGDLQDVVNLLDKSPMTRQAYLPVWFPEDTGNVMGERVPCTLGYHFQIRDGELNCTYLMRSCDFFRHFKDDVYMAGRLMLWVASRLSEDDWTPEVKPGNLAVHIMNLHTFVGERHRLKEEIDQWVSPE